LDNNLYVKFFIQTGNLDYLLYRLKIISALRQLISNVSLSLLLKPRTCV